MGNSGNSTNHYYIITSNAYFGIEWRGNEGQADVLFFKCWYGEK